MVRGNGAEDAARAVYAELASDLAEVVLCEDSAWDSFVTQSWCIVVVSFFDRDGALAFARTKHCQPTRCRIISVGVDRRHMLSQNGSHTTRGRLTTLEGMMRSIRTSLAVEARLQMRAEFHRRRRSGALVAAMEGAANLTAVHRGIAPLVDHVGCSRTTLWRHWRAVARPGARLQDLFDWSVLVEAVSRKGHRSSWIDIATELGAHHVTIARAALRLFGKSLKQLEARPDQVLSHDSVDSMIETFLGSGSHITPNVRRLAISHEAVSKHAEAGAACSQRVI